MSSARFEVYKDKKKEFRWTLKARNGRTIADCGEGYTTKQECRRSIDRMMDVLACLTIVVERK